MRPNEPDGRISAPGRPDLGQAGIAANAAAEWSLRAVVVLIAATACGAAESGDTPLLRHPALEYRVRERVQYTEFDLSGIGQVSSADLNARRPKVSRRIVVGESAGTLATAFGRIVDVAVDAGHQVHVVDDRYSNVRVYTRDGRLKQTLGRAGTGLGEFKVPLALALDDAESIFVGTLDHGIHVFRGGPEGHVPERRMRIDVAPKSMCLLGRRLFVAGALLDEPYGIRAYDEHGGLVANFAETYASPNALVNHELRSGSVSCDRWNDLVLYASADPLAEVRAYTPDGTIRWAVEFTGVNVTHLIDLPRGYRLDSPVGGKHRLYSVVPLARDLLLVQVLFASETAHDVTFSAARVASIALDPRTGSVLWTTETMPPIAAAAGAIGISPHQLPTEGFSILDIREVSR